MSTTRQLSLREERQRDGASGDLVKRQRPGNLQRSEAEKVRGDALARGCASDNGQLVLLVRWEGDVSCNRKRVAVTTGFRCEVVNRASTHDDWSVTGHVSLRRHEPLRLGNRATTWVFCASEWYTRAHMLSSIRHAHDWLLVEGTLMFDYSWPSPHPCSEPALWVKGFSTPGQIQNRDQGFRLGNQRVYFWQLSQRALGHSKRTSMLGPKS
jgi:hypothetical protein